MRNLKETKDNCEMFRCLASLLLAVPAITPTCLICFEHVVFFTA